MKNSITFSAFLTFKIKTKVVYVNTVLQLKMFLPFSIHEMLPWLKLISLHPKHIKSDLLPSHPEALLSFFSFFFLVKYA